MFETCDLTKPSSSKQNNRKMIQQQYSNMPCKPRTLGSRNGATRPMVVLTPRSPHLSLHGGTLPPVGTRAHTSSQACVQQQQQQGTTTSTTKTSIERIMLFAHQEPNADAKHTLVHGDCVCPTNTKFAILETFGDHSPHRNGTENTSNRHTQPICKKCDKKTTLQP